MSAVGLLAGNIAHELNNPLTGLRSLSQVLLQEVPESEQLHRDLKEIEQGVQRCEEIIHSLLNFSNVGSDSRIRKTDLGKLTASTLSFLKSAMRDHSTQIELGEEAFWVQVEPHMMQQVIFNLVNNACQSMTEPGELRIEIKEESGAVHLSVTDRGRGIRPDHLPHIFDPFYTTKEEGQGTGLGLSMSRTVVESFGGKIVVETQVGQGTTFTVTLPGGKG